MYLLLCLIMYIWYQITSTVKENKNVSTRSQATYVLDFIFRNTWCGVKNDINARSDGTIKLDNFGPRWSRGITWDNYCGNHINTNYEQDWWLHGSALQTIADYSLLHKDGQFFDTIGDISSSGLLLNQLLTRNIYTYQQPYVSPDKKNNKSFKNNRLGDSSQIIITVNPDTFGVNNDDRLWYALAFVQMFKFDKLKYAMLFNWAIQIYKECRLSFVTLQCGKTERRGLTWGQRSWESKKDDGPQTSTYVNSVTNNEMLALALDMQDLLVLSSSTKDFLNDLRDDISDLTDLLQLLVISKDNKVDCDMGDVIFDQVQVTNLLADGFCCKDNKYCCVIGGGIYTYNQGMFIHNMVRIALAEYYSDHIDAYVKLMSTAMDVLRMVTTDTDSLILSKQDGALILIEPFHASADDNSGNAFKGICVREIAYAIKKLQEFIIGKKSDVPLLGAISQAIGDTVAFVINNTKSVIKNGQGQGGLYSYYWGQPQNTLYEKYFNTASTFSAIDLFNAYFLLTGSPVETLGPTSQLLGNYVKTCKPTSMTKVEYSCKKKDDKSSNATTIDPWNIRRVGSIQNIDGDLKYQTMINTSLFNIDRVR